MDSEDLLARENEFKKLNKQLEKKTESLMKEIEHVMQKQDIFSEFSKLSLSPVHGNSKKHCCMTPQSSNSTPEKKYPTLHKKTKISQVSQQKVPIQTKETKCNVTDCNNITTCTEGNTSYDGITPHTDGIVTAFNNVTSCTGEQRSNGRCKCECYLMSSDSRRNSDLEFLYAFVSVSVKDNILPASFLKDSPTVESVCKFLSAKVKLIQEQIDKLQNTIEKKAKQCESHMTHLAELEGERLKLMTTANSSRADAADTKAKYAAMQNRLNEKDRLYKEQRSVTDKLTTEVKQLRSKNASLEARCASQDASIATLKQQLETFKMAEKEFRDSTRTLSASHQSTIHRLESRIKTLTLRTDRQKALIDNLRKQNALLQTEGALKALEKEYGEFLKQDF